MRASLKSSVQNEKKTFKKKMIHYWENLLKLKIETIQKKRISSAVVWSSFHKLNLWIEYEVYALDYINVYSWNDLLANTMFISAKIFNENIFILKYYLTYYQNAHTKAR